MSEVASRSSATRGRGSGRGGRGGFAGRGGRSRTNGDKSDHKDENLGAFEDEGEFAELRKQYGDKTSVIREMFPDWSEADVLFALQETNGDENEAVARIAEGTVSQWGEVSKPKKTIRTKAKETTTAAAGEPAASSSRSARGGRAVAEAGRGRGRGFERGARGGAGRGRSSQPSTNGTRNKENQQLSVPTEESPAWDSPKSKDDKLELKSTTADKSAPVEPAKPAAPAAKTWASMLRQSTALNPTPTAPKEVPASKPVDLEAQPVPEPVPAEPGLVEPTEEETTPVAQRAVPVPASASVIATEPEATLPPSKDELTETNLEQVVDASNPPATGTAASTAADSWDPRQSPISSSTTPISAAHHQHQAQRTAASGYAASAIKATTERSARAPSFQRRVLDQEEAVRMPGNREVDRAAVKFGAFSLNDGDEDVDGEREEAETRAQPPADSPVAHPRASLPPVSQPVAVPESFSQKTTGIVPSAVTGAVPTAPAAAQASATTATQQFGRFVPPDSAAATQKPLDPFNAAQPAPSSQPQFDSFATQTTQPQAQQPGAAFTSTPSDYSNYYTANQQDRNTYNVYGQQYGAQQAAHGQHDGVSQQRPFAGYNVADNLSQYPQSGSLHNQPRFGGSNESQNSGHSTPNPAAQAQQQGQQAQQAQQAQPSQQPQQGAPGSQPQSHGQYPGYNHPYYSNPYYHQYYSGYGQGGFGPYGGKGGMYGQPYGMSPNAPYDHASSPSTFGGPSSLHRDSSLGSGLGEYGRAASGQAGSQPGLGGSSFGGAHESFARGTSSFQSQNQSFNSQTQAPASGSADDLKHFGDAKTAASGPSPSLAGGPRPGSATNNAPSGGQSGLPPPQNSQMGGAYGGYPSHLQGHNLHGSTYGMGAGAGASQHGNTPYGSYGQGFGSGGYYGGGQQQRGGWGGNYH
ncbi:UBA-like protein [Metarhizium album ARSEF 1941]|uniref:RNA polymerase II degradation factor 1 n=1 Tax=Metarhizium album (strain ARSEF 1941) TaxID=1081103 RepID=A0A0B2X2J2_METAS|nr:UBA-like protein [Metarhizium album ARSEF 1941]KHN99957.1 UBA-like protein [Metarhizium album ARSEF 1941]